MFFDSHCHLTDAQFASDRAAVLERAAQAAVTRVVTICSDLADAVAARDLAHENDGVWCTAGIHPHAAAKADRGSLDRIREVIEDPKVVGVGETGLDYYYDNAPRSVQRKLLEQHLQLASDHELPLIVHSREADDDTIDMLRSVEGAVRGVLHCFAGGAALLDAGIEAGWMISFSGLVTFRNFTGADLLRAVPSAQLLIETDSPYLAPVPHRGKRNEPSYLPQVAEAVARIRGMDAAEIGALTSANALRFYALMADAGQLVSTTQEER